MILFRKVCNFSGSALALIGGKRDRLAIGSAAQHAVLILAELRHGVGKPNAAIDDQAEHQKSKNIVHHPVAIIVLLAPRIFADIFDWRSPRVMTAVITAVMAPLIIVPGTRHARPE